VPAYAGTREMVTNKEDYMKYARMLEIKNENRQWPAKKITKSPVWCAHDLRDGNQALPNPMTPQQKLEYFQLLVSIGFKQIEIGFPSASEDDFNLARLLIEKKLIPDDVTIAVLTQSREHLIDRTIESISGAKNVIIHQYFATSDLHMKYVFGLSRQDVVDATVAATKRIREKSAPLVKAGYNIALEFSPEEFSDTDPAFATHICDEVVRAWAPAAGEKVILNLPMTVERRLPNEYADMVEVFMRSNGYPDNTIISLHVHNDMGCAVAATAMALMAGAHRVEGTLLGHGERTGNVDLITLALDLEYMGIDTGLDFSHLTEIVSKVESITDIPVHVRHPYSGQLVFTAFSGSHQDAIGKGLSRRDELAKEFGGWKIPYLHVDPSSLGRTFEKFIRINSQSGKGGVAFIMQQQFHISMPKWAQADFAKAVQQYADRQAREIEGGEVYDLFEKEYLSNSGKISLVNFWPRPDENDPSLVNGEVVILTDGKEIRGSSTGNGPISAFVAALKSLNVVEDFEVDDYVEDSTGHTSDSFAVCFVRLKSDGNYSVGAGLNPNVNQAAVSALISALNRLQ